jgi:hypothetical protein
MSIIVVDEKVIGTDRLFWLRIVKTTGQIGQTD